MCLKFSFTHFTVFNIVEGIINWYGIILIYLCCIRYECNTCLLFQAAAARPLISVYGEKGDASGTNVTLPAVFRAPIRPDIVTFVHAQMRFNSRQPYAVSEKAGKG